MINRRTWMSVILALLALLGVPGRAAAQSGTWITNAAGNWSDAGNWSGGTIADGSSQTADFGTLNIDTNLTVTLDSSRTIGHLRFSDADTNSAAGWILKAAGTNTLTLAGGSTITVTNLAPGAMVDLNVPLAGGETIMVRGGGHVMFSATNTMTGHMYIGTTDDSNTATFSVRGFTVPSPGRECIVGRGRKFNTMTVAAGCIARWRAGAEIGGDAGGVSNTLVVTGPGAQVIIDNNGGSQFNMGVRGASGNRLVVSNGGYLRPQKFVIGRSGGTDNAALITGVGSQVSVGAGNQGSLNVGAENGGSARNSITLENGGHLLYQSPEYKSGGSIGDSNDADDNYIRVKAGGTFSFLHSTPNSLPFVLGAFNGRDGSNHQSFPVDANASGNHLDIVGGGVFVTANASVYLMGTNSAINLGDGDGISQATVSANAASYKGFDYAPGIVLFKPDARLNFNSGRLTAAAGGKMISGPGVVSNAGPAYVSTSFTDSSIDSLIVGSGDLIKEGSGTLALSATNTFNGVTMVSNGVLRLTHKHCLPEMAELRISEASKVDLAYTGIQKIRSLQIAGAQQPAGFYGEDRIGTYFSGNGLLQVQGDSASNLLFILR